MQNFIFQEKSNPTAIPADARDTSEVTSDWKYEARNSSKWI